MIMLMRIRILLFYLLLEMMENLSIEYHIIVLLNSGITIDDEAQAKNIITVGASSQNYVSNKKYIYLLLL